MTTTKSTSNCPICGSDVFSIHLAGVRDYNFGGIEGSFDIATCMACGTRQQWPMLTKEQALAFYPENYTHYNFSKSKIRTLLMKLYFRPLIQSLRATGLSEGSSLLDIGSGSGEKAAFLRDELGIDVIGLEPNGGASKKALEIFDVKTINDFFPSKKLGNKKFDVIYLNHVIEHVPDPLNLLREIYNHLKPGGYLYGETENSDALSAKFFGKYWSLYHMPFHLYFFTNQTLSALFRKVDFGELQVQTSWDPSCIPISISNWTRRNKKPNEIPGPKINFYMVKMFFWLPLSFLDRPRGPVLKFQARRPINSQ